MMRWLRTLLTPTCLVCHRLILDDTLWRLCRSCWQVCLACRHQNETGHHIPAYGYLPPITTLLHQLKYQGCRLSGHALVDLMVDAWQDHPWHHYDGVLVMPAHPKRIRERGAHVADMLMRHTLKRLGYASLLDTQLGWRVGYAPTQAGLTRKQRAENIHPGLFAMPKCQGHWVLFDDVVTTGQSMHACLAALQTSDATFTRMCLAQASA